jgi:hypothetical protein
MNFLLLVFHLMGKIQLMLAQTNHLTPLGLIQTLILKIDATEFFI